MYSMTGFGKTEVNIQNQQFNIEIKSVNHRHLDARFRLPPNLTAFELGLNEILRKHFERGSFDISVRQKGYSAAGNVSQGTRFIVDETAARSLSDGVAQLNKVLGTNAVADLSFYLNSGRVFLAIEESTDTSELWEAFRKAFENGITELKKMRLAEGLRLKQILVDGTQELIKGVESLSRLAPLQTQKVKEKLEGRLAQWKVGAPIDSQRLEWEVALLAEKADITEEINRLKTHAAEFLTIIESPKGVGRKLDFLTQELHREVNTTASKSACIEITQTAVNLKTQIEKLREQVQNVE